MKTTSLMLGLLVLPGIALAGGAGNLSLYNSTTTPATTATAPAASLISTENPISILESRSDATTNDNFLQYSFGYIPNSFWASYGGNLQDINGFIEAEEYFGETRRSEYQVGESLDREDERQTRAQNKAMRLRFIGQ